MFKKVLSFIFISLVFIFGCNKSKKDTVKDSEIKTSSIITVNYNQLKPYLERKDHKTYVINFWATWCGPCVKELPYFEYVTEKYQDKNVEVLLVSLDFPKDVETKLIPFLNKKNIQSKVVLLDDFNEDFWINAIDSSWSGAIPATLIYNQNNRKFYEQSFTKEELISQLETFLKS